LKGSFVVMKLLNSFIGVAMLKNYELLRSLFKFD
jgi:hypothetical protein